MIRKSRETFDRFMIFKSKKNTQSRRHLRSASEGTLRRAGFYDFLLLRARIANPR